VKIKIQNGKPAEFNKQNKVDGDELLDEKPNFSKPIFKGPSAGSERCYSSDKRTDKGLAPSR